MKALKITEMPECLSDLWSEAQSYARRSGLSLRRQPLKLPGGFATIGYEALRGGAVVLSLHQDRMSDETAAAGRRRLNRFVGQVRDVALFESRYLSDGGMVDHALSV